MSNDDSLLCFTNNASCCNNEMGEWYFPNMSSVRIKGEGNGFYRDRGQSVVHLHRMHNTTMHNTTKTTNSTEITTSSSIVSMSPTEADIISTMSQRFQ